MNDPKGRVVDETSRDRILERARCIGIVRAAMDRYHDHPATYYLLKGLVEEMEERRLADLREPANGER